MIFMKMGKKTWNENSTNTTCKKKKKEKRPNKISYVN